jgi:hypothetical protein
MKMKVLVTVMTYPSLSGKHFETVCTAGFKEDGSWIRIFPVPLRLMPTEDGDLPYHKWQWIEVDLEQDLNHDDRPESYRIRDIESLNVLGSVDGKRTDWSVRLEWVLKNKTVFTNMTELLNLTQQNRLSLAVLKPSCIKKVTAEKASIDEDYRQKLKRLRNQYEAEQSELLLFGQPEIKRNFIFAEKIPYKFRYVFETDDGKERSLMIEDWEIIQLFRKLRKKYDDKTSCEKVIDKYMRLAKENDIHLFLGTSYEWQKKNSSDPYMIIGVFYPPKGTVVQPSLFNL